MVNPLRKVKVSSPLRKPDSLDLLLRDQSTDEKTGAHATLGFTYQQWWGTLKIAEILATGKDFAIGMEFKGDVALMDSPVSPSCIEFCQIKKNEQTGAWTLKELHAPGPKRKTTGAEPSTLAKLYKLRSDFVGHPIALSFVSNVSFKIPTADGSMVNSHNYHLLDLAAPHQTTLKKALSGQLSVDETSICLSDFRLNRTNLPLGEQHAFVGGKLSELCENHQLPFSLSQPTVAARMLASELQDRAANTSYASSFAELKVRLFSRTDALSVLARVSAAKPAIGATLDAAIERLNSENYAFLMVKTIVAERVHVCSHAVDRTNLQFRNIAGSLLSAQESVIQAAPPNATLGILMEMLVQAAKSKMTNEFLGTTQGYINAVALLVLNDGIDIDVLTTSAGAQLEVAK